ncbi:MAG: sensor domain-containing diguanylate cyclase [Chloroflexota bacterium]
MLNLHDSELRYRRLFEAAQDGILILDAQTGLIKDVNPFLIKMLGYSYQEIVQRKLWEVGAFKDIEASLEAFEALQKKEYIRYENLPLKTRDGRLIQVEFVSNVYLVGDEKVIQCNIRDITERAQLQKALARNEALMRRESTRDHLTGLFNRQYMEETLDREMARALRQNSPLSILVVDVDEFKHINDIFGHAVGDTILRKLSKMLIRHVRTEDIPSRYGGDEFIIVMPGASSKLACERAARLCEHARHFHPTCDGQTLEKITLSIGVATYPKDGATSAAVLKAVDSALYHAKLAGRDQVKVTV